MKVEKHIINQIEKADAVFIIGVKGNTHFTSIQGKYSDDLETVHHITQGMLGSINDSLNGSKFNNSLPLLITIKEATKIFPQLLSLLK